MMTAKRERDCNFVTDLTLGLVDTLRKVLPLGNMELHPLGRVNRLGSGRGSGDPLAPSITDLSLAGEEEPRDQPEPLRPGVSRATSPAPPTFHSSKMFEVDSCQGYGRVVVAYPGRGEAFSEGSFWFIDPSLRPHLLATDTHTYWRLMMAHLGMPQWQALVAGLGLTPWARQWYEVVAGHLLEGSRSARLSQSQELVNKLDWSVFKNKKTHKTKAAKDTPKDANKDTAKDANKEATKDTGKQKE
ncbi:tubulin polyglutamylase complex subunit 2 isoform X2 [Panulirus ornatus]|uniref:tubulin polyglutamylase complex subunit 2 isoform X2 n=1 Tax=Panulirus ornatus TaxID=150431 RepID=UPI003A8AD520